MRTCRSCGTDKPPTEYHRDARYRDGLNTSCKVCRRATVRAHYQRNPEPTKARVRARHHKMMQDAAWREAERERSREKIARRGHLWAKVPPHQKAANSAVSNAIRDGRLVPPGACEQCGHDFSTYRREAHHPDYSKPLDVEWLCVRCHRAHHARRVA